MYVIWLNDKRNYYKNASLWQKIFGVSLLSRFFPFLLTVFVSSPVVTNRSALNFFSFSISSSARRKYSVSLSTRLMWDCNQECHLSASSSTFVNQTLQTRIFSEGTAYRRSINSMIFLQTIETTPGTSTIQIPYKILYIPIYLVHE